MIVNWVKTQTGGDNLRTYCERCEASFTAKLPMEVSSFVALVEAFLKEHRKCQPKPKERP